MADSEAHAQETAQISLRCLGMSLSAPMGLNGNPAMDSGCQPLLKQMPFLTDQLTRSQTLGS